MRKFLLMTVLALPVTAARADVVFQNMLSGTGDNVVFDHQAGNVAVGGFNGQHTGFVDFTDLSNNPGFTAGLGTGNDIKLANTSDLSIVVFNSMNQETDTTKQVFSLLGAGDVTATVYASDGAFTHDLGHLDNNQQSKWTMLAINNETISKVVLDVTSFVGCNCTPEITDFEHYRIDVAPTASVPGPALGTGLPGAAFAALGMLWFGRNRQQRLNGGWL